MLSGCLLYFLVILAMHNLHAVLPPCVDTLTRLDRNSLIEHYFHLGLDYSEILGSLLLCHGIQISLCQLKGILSSNGLFRRRASSKQVWQISKIPETRDVELRHVLKLLFLDLLSNSFPTRFVAPLSVEVCQNSIQLGSS